MAEAHGMDHIEVFRALFSGAHGPGGFTLGPDEISREDAERIWKHNTLNNKGRLYFDYFRGRALKVEIPEGKISWLSTDFYDRDNGRGAAQEALDDWYTRP